MTEPGNGETINATIHIVEDDESLRRATARFIEISGYDVRTYGSADEFLAGHVTGTGAPGCLVLDVRLPGSSGLDLQRILASTAEPLPIIFLSGLAAVPDSVRAMKSGAVDFLTKPVDGSVLLNAIAQALARDADNRALRARRTMLRERFERLTLREREVFAHLISGQLNKQVGYDLGISERTVKQHRRQVLEKMEAGSIAELVRMAGDLEIPPEGGVR